MGGGVFAMTRFETTSCNTRKRSCSGHPERRKPSISRLEELDARGVTCCPRFHDKSSTHGGPGVPVNAAHDLLTPEPAQTPHAITAPAFSDCNNARFTHAHGPRQSGISTISISTIGMQKWQLSRNGASPEMASNLSPLSKSVEVLSLG
jgi:hypothetical protein